MNLLHSLDPVHVMYLLVFAAGAASGVLGLRTLGLVGHSMRKYRHEEGPEGRKQKWKGRLEALTETMPGVPCEFQVGPDGEQSIVFIGEGATGLLGLATEPNGFCQRFVEHISDSHRETFLQSVEEAIATRSHWRQEVPFERPDGERVWLLGFAEPEFRGEGVLFRGVLFDITERVEEKQRREQVIRHVTDAIVEVDAEWRFTLVNDQAEALYEMTEENLLGKSFWDVFAQAKETRFEEEYRQVMRSREPVRFEEYFEGLEAWFDIQVYPNPDGGLAFYFDDVTERREQEEQLRERGEMLRSITENVSEGIYRSTPDEGIIYANSAFVEMFGYENLDELRAIDLSELYVGSTGRKAFHRREVDPDGIDGVEVQFRRRDGSTFSGLVSTQTVEGADGKCTYNDGAVTDITERKRKARRLEAVFNHTYQFTGLMEPDGTMVEVNDTALQFGDLEREDVVGKPLWETRWAQTGSESKQKLKEAIQRAAEGEFVRYERPVLGKEETRITDFSIRPVTNEEGEVELLVPEARDITQLKRREKTLQARQQKIEALYRATSGLFSIDHRDTVPDRILVVLEEVFDIPLAHVGLMEGEILVPKETVVKDLSRRPDPQPRPIDADLAATRAIRSGEAIVVQSADDLENELDYGTLSTLAGIPIAGHGAVVLGKEYGSFDTFDLHLLEVLASYAALAVDRLEREERLVQAREEAEEAAQLKSAMLANMSHEIRTPLMSMIGSADLLREDLEGEPAEMVAQIFQSGQRLRETLDSVLQLSRLESGVYTLDDNPAYLDVIVREVAQELNLKAHEKGVRLEVDTSEGSVEARLDETAVRRIATNLVENAIKFTPEGGEVQVRVRPEDEETVLLEVEDTGVGIAEEARENIFDAFKQESEGLGREYEGSGLGLSIVHRLTTLMDGTIEVESEKGIGTCFAVRFSR